MNEHRRSGNRKRKYTRLPRCIFTLKARGCLDRPTPPRESRVQSSWSCPPPPPGLEAEHATLFSTGALHFLHELISTFDDEVDQILELRVSRKVHLDLSGDLPDFLESTAHIRTDPTWKVLPVPQRLRRRHVDIGDMAPCDTQRFIKSLQSSAQGIQVDFDDGNCPTFHNQIKGIHNVVQAVNSQIPDVPHISQAPVLMLRPRAWNMVEHNMMAYSRPRRTPRAPVYPLYPPAPAPPLAPAYPRPRRIPGPGVPPIPPGSGVPPYPLASAYPLAPAYPRPRRIPGPGVSPAPACPWPRRIPGPGVSPAPAYPWPRRIPAPPL
ncbi:uncharacterized protein FYW49_005955 [Xenentodon cancila]